MGRGFAGELDRKAPELCPVIGRVCTEGEGTRMEDVAIGDTLETPLREKLAGDEALSGDDVTGELSDLEEELE